MLIGYTLVTYNVMFYLNELDLPQKTTDSEGPDQTTNLHSSPNERSEQIICMFRLMCFFLGLISQIVSLPHLYITKTYLYNFDPLKPHFNIVKLGFTGVYIISLISALNIDCGYSLEPSHRGGSNEYPQSMF